MMEIRRTDRYQLHNGIYGLAKLEIIADTLDIDIIEAFSEWIDACNKKEELFNELMQLIKVKEKQNE